MTDSYTVEELGAQLRTLTNQVAALGSRLEETVKVVEASCAGGRALEGATRELRQELLEVRALVTNQQARCPGKQHFKVPPPSKFVNADGTKTLKSWMASFRAYCAYTDAALTEDMMRSYLGGDALSAYLAHQATCPSEERVRTLDDFERILMQLTNLGNSQEVARQQMKLLWQGDSLISVYNTQFSELAIACPDRSEFDKIGDYVDGLNVLIQKDVKMRKCTTLGKAMQCAVAASGVVGSTVGARPDGVLQAGGGPSPMEVDKLYAMFAAMNAQNDSSREGGKICWNCEEVGHLAKNCPKPKRSGRKGRY